MTRTCLETYVWSSHILLQQSQFQSQFCNSSNALPHPDTRDHPSGNLKSLRNYLNWKLVHMQALFDIWNRKAFISLFIYLDFVWQHSRFCRIPLIFLRWYSPMPCSLWLSWLCRYLACQANEINFFMMNWTNFTLKTSISTVAFSTPTYSLKVTWTILPLFYKIYF